MHKSAKRYRKKFPNFKNTKNQWRNVVKLLKLSENRRQLAENGEGKRRHWAMKSRKSNWNRVVKR